MRFDHNQFSMTVGNQLNVPYFQKQIEKYVVNLKYQKI